VIEPLHLLYGGSLEGDVARWVDEMLDMGWTEDYDGSDRPGLAVAICEDLPSSEYPFGRAWDPEEWVVRVWAGQDGRPLGFHFFGPSTWKQLMAGVAASN